MTPRSVNKDDRIFVRNGRRLYRRRYSLREPRAGAVILVVLALIVAWIAWKGAHPDPTLFMLETDLAQAPAQPAAVVASVDRGPVPEGLAAAGWTEGEISQFDSDNLYEKIDGREGYYKALGFERLYAASITSDADAATAVDIELYDLGSAANALGAYSGERPPGVEPTVTETGLMHIDRNTFCLARGRYYLRALGSEESPEVRAVLEHLRDRFVATLPGEPLPWGYALFVGKMGADAGAVSYTRENAFSFGFASNVYSASLDDESELFVTPTASEADASDLAGRFVDGFMRYGTKEGDAVKDRYVGTYAMVESEGQWVVGVRRAPNPDAARSAVDTLVDLVKDYPVPDIPASATPETEQEEYGESYDG
jgi:hypothetical protein